MSTDTQTISNTLRDAANKALFQVALVPKGTLYESVTQLEKLQAELNRARNALGQASFCLRQLAPNDPDAQLTVKMIELAR